MFEFIHVNNVMAIDSIIVNSSTYILTNGLMYEVRWTNNGVDVIDVSWL